MDEREDEDGLVWQWNNLDNVTAWLEVARGAIETVPLYLYEHGALLLTTEDPRLSIDPGGWDTTAVGFIYTTRERVAERLRLNPAGCRGTRGQWVREALRDEVREYSLALDGLVSAS